jgi:hypothetical protein
MGFIILWGSGKAGRPGTFICTPLLSSPGIDENRQSIHHQIHDWRGNLMKRVTLFALMLILSTGLVLAQQMSKGKGMMSMSKQKEVSIKGEVVDVSCYLHNGARGEGHKECAIACAKAGGPLGILTSNGKLYVSVLPDDHSSGPNDKLMDHIAQTVTAKGMVRSRGGVNGIMITNVEMAN